MPWYRPSTWGVSEQPAAVRNLDLRPQTRSLVDMPWAHDTGYGVNRAQPVSQDRALSLAPVYAAVSLIAGDISTLPVKAYRYIDQDERQPMNSLPQLFERLRARGELVPWLHRCMASLLLRGNAHGLVTERDGFGFPIAIVWLDPRDMTPDLRPGREGRWLYQGRPVNTDEVVHIAKFVFPGSAEGLSPIGAFAQMIGVGLHAQAYGYDYFANGGTPPGLFRNTEQPIPDPEQAAVIKQRLGQAIRSREPLVYGRDWEYKPISVNPAEAQFLQTIKANATTVATIYHVPAERIGGETANSLTYSTVELNRIAYVQDALRPWLVVLESAFSAMLPERQYVRFNSDALIRTDIRTQHEVLIADIDAGLRSRDEVRRILDLPPLPDGLGEFGATAPIARQPADPDPPANVVPLARGQ